jgi:amino acid transporter
VNGFTAWAYWLGWFPVAPLNMILASFYIVDRFKLDVTVAAQMSLRCLTGREELV